MLNNIKILSEINEYVLGSSQINICEIVQQRTFLLDQIRRILKFTAVILFKKMITTALGVNGNVMKIASLNINHAMRHVNHGISSAKTNQNAYIMLIYVMDVKIAKTAVTRRIVHKIVKLEKVCDIMESMRNRERFSVMVTKHVQSIPAMKSV